VRPAALVGICGIRVKASCPVRSAAGSVGAAKSAPRRAVFRGIIKKCRPPAQAVANVRTGWGADREASVGAVRKVGIRQGIGAARHEAASCKGG